MPKNFYFFHIDKTVSLWFDVTLMSQLYSMMEKKGIDTSLNYSHRDHNFWRPLDSDTFIFSVFREPVSRAVSDFCYTMLYDELHQYRSIDHIVKQNSYNINMKNFEQWVNTVHTPNFQAKALYGAGEVRSKDDIVDRITRINLMLRTDDLWEVKQKDVFNYIIKVLNLGETRERVPTYFEKAWFEHISMGFYHELLQENNELLKQVKELNRIDLEIWNNNNFFPSGLSNCL